MTTLKNNEYIVFQPDQVLTNDHLNQLFFYLDSQERLTRNKLIGMGIVCGLDLVITTDNQSVLQTIGINKGCGLSSEGYLLIERENKVYTHAVLYTPPAQPVDLPFQCNTVPFYASDKALYNSGAPIYQLMTCQQITVYTSNPSNTVTTDPCAGFSNLGNTGGTGTSSGTGNTGTSTGVTTPSSFPAGTSPSNPTGVPVATQPGTVVRSSGTPASPPSSPPGQTPAAQPFPLSNPPSGISLSAYAVVLFLEASEKDLKNCNMQDCDNKGEKMVFTLRPLLVPKKYLTNNCSSQLNSQKAPEIRLKRFNVAYTELSDSAAILNAFHEIFSNNILATVADAYSYCYNTWKNLLPNTDNPFSPTLSPPATTPMLDHLQKLLDGIWLQTNRTTIQYFYDYINDLILAYYEFRSAASCLNIQCCADECAFPLHLVLGQATVSTNELVKDCWRQYFIYSPLYDPCKQSQARLRFYFHRMEILAAQSPFPLGIVNSDRKILITPSQYQEFPLSQRAIPYYYKEVADDPDSLYQYWNFEKTLAGNAAFNLSYNAHIYNAYDLIVNEPLEYDIEPYHFFRIEGHIGLPYTEVLIALLHERQTYNVPFDIVAVSAELLKNGQGKIPTCNILDLQTDFKLLLAEFLCKLLLCILRLIRFPYNPKGFASNAILVNTGPGSPDTTPISTDWINQLQQNAGSYKYGDFISGLSPEDGTVGKAYLDSVQSGQFSNPIDFTYINETNQASQVRLYHNVFQLLNTADNLFYLLLNTGMADLDPGTVSTQYESFNTALAQLRTPVLSSAGGSTGSGTLTLLGQAAVNPQAAPGISPAPPPPATGTTLNLMRDTAITTNPTPQAQNTIDTGTPSLAAYLDACGCDCLICLVEGMLVLLAEYIRRVKLYQSQLSFLNYYRNHPGLEHKSGVPKGGTFVLVYHQEDATISNDSFSNTATMSKVQDILSSGSGYSPEFMRQFTALVNRYQPDATIVHPIPDGTVIADFYVPWICCSDCPPVAYVLPTDTPPPPKVVFDIQPKTFLYDDAHNYPFTTTPAVTSLNQVQKPFSSPDLANPGNLKLLTDANNTLYLHPAMNDAADGNILKATLNTTLTWKGVKVAITIIRPDASFTIQVTQAGYNAAQIQVTAKIQDTLATYAWTVNGSSTIFSPVAAPPPVVISALPINPVGTYQITLVVSYTINNDISTDMKTTVLTPDIIKKITNQGTPYTPVFQ